MKTYTVDHVNARMVQLDDTEAYPPGMTLPMVGEWVKREDAEAVIQALRQEIRELEFEVSNLKETVVRRSPAYLFGATD